MGLLRDTNLRIIIGIVVMGVMGGSLVAPILPSMIEPLQTSRETIGLVLSVYTLFAMVFTPLLGVLADRIGRKKVLIPAIIIYGLGGSLIALAQSFAIILVLRALQGIGAAGMMNLGVALIGDLYHGQQRGPAMGYRTSAQNITTAAAPFVAGALATIAWFYPFFIYTLALPVGVIAAVKLKLPKNHFSQSILKYLKSLLGILRSYHTVQIFACNLLAFTLLYCLIVYFPILLAERFSLSPLYAGIGISVASSASAIVASQSGKLMNRFQKKPLVATGFVICGLALLLIPLGTSYFVLILFLILWGLGFGTTLPTLNTLAIEAAPTRLRAGLVSGFTTTTYIGQTLSPPLFGLILHYTNLGWVFLSATMIALIPILLLIVGRHWVKK